MHSQALPSHSSTYLHACFPQLGLHLFLHLQTRDDLVALLLGAAGVQHVARVGHVPAEREREREREGRETRERERGVRVVRKTDRRDEADENERRRGVTPPGGRGIPFTRQQPAPPPMHMRTHTQTRDTYSLRPTVSDRALDRV